MDERVASLSEPRGGERRVEPGVILVATPPLPGADAGPLPLVAGQVLTARVVGARGEELVLALLGRRVPARSSLPLEAGQLLRVRVEGAAAGAVRLRLLAPAAPAPARAGPAERVAALLRSLGVAPGPDAEAAVRGLVAAGLPVTGSRLRAVLAALRRHPGERLATATAAALLLGRGVAPRGEALAALQAHLEGLPPFGDTVDRLLRLARATAGPPERADQEGGPPATLLRSLVALLEALTLPGQPPAEGEGAGLARRLAEAVRLLGLDHERATYGPPAGGSPLGGDGQPASLKGLLLALRAHLAAGEGAAPAAAGGGADAGREAEAGSAGPFRQAVEDGLRALTAWQLLSAEPDAPQPADRCLLVFHLPVALGPFTGTVEASVERWAARGTRPEGGDGQEAGGDSGGEVAVRLRLETPGLGEVRVRLALRGRRLGVSVAAATPAAVAALDAGQEELVRRLEGHGFDVAGVAVSRLARRVGARAADLAGVDLFV